MNDHIILIQKGKAPKLKGPFKTKRQLEDFLRDCYSTFPDCTSIVAELEVTSYPIDGRGWVSMYGDKRRRQLPRPDLFADHNLGIAPRTEQRVKESIANCKAIKDYIANNGAGSPETKWNDVTICQKCGGQIKPGKAIEHVAEAPEDQ